MPYFLHVLAVHVCKHPSLRCFSCISSGLASVADMKTHAGSVPEQLKIHYNKRMSSHLNTFLYHFKARRNITVAPHLLYAYAS